MTTELQNIPIFVLEHKWSSDIESNLYSDVEDAHIDLLDYSKMLTSCSIAIPNLNICVHPITFIEKIIIFNAQLPSNVALYL